MLCARVWPPIVRRFVLAAILQVPGLELREVLFKAADIGYVDVVDALLKAGAAVDSQERCRLCGGVAVWRCGASVPVLLEANATVDSNATIDTQSGP